MDEQIKSDLQKCGAAVSFILGVGLGLAAGVGCIICAALAKEAGKPGGIYLLVGLANIVYLGGVLFLAGKKAFTNKEEE